MNPIITLTPTSTTPRKATLGNIKDTLGYEIGKDIKMIVSSHATKMAADVKSTMGKAAQDHGVLFLSMGQVQGIVMDQLQAATKKLGAPWDIKKLKARPQKCDNIDVHWAMPGAPDFTTDIMLQVAVSEAKTAFKKGGCNLINFEAPDPDEEVGMDEINALGLKPTGIGVARHRQ
jgi:hypothetical protein